MGLAGCSFDRSRSIDLTTVSPAWQKDECVFLTWVGDSAEFGLWTQGPAGDVAFDLTVVNKRDATIRVSLRHPRESEWDGFVCSYYTKDSRGEFVEGYYPHQPARVLRVGGSVEVPARGLVSMSLGTKFYDHWPPRPGDRLSFVITASDGDRVLDACPAEFVVAGIVESVTIRKHFGH